MLRNSSRPVGLTTESLSCCRAWPIAWSHRPRQPDLARLLSAIVADGSTGRRLFGDDDVPGGIDDDDDPDWDKEPL